MRLPSRPTVYRELADTPYNCRLRRRSLRHTGSSAVSSARRWKRRRWTDESAESCPAPVSLGLTEFGRREPYWSSLTPSSRVALAANATPKPRGTATRRMVHGVLVASYGSLIRVPHSPSRTGLVAVAIFSGRSRARDDKSGRASIWEPTIWDPVFSGRTIPKLRCADVKRWRLDRCSPGVLSRLLDRYYRP